MSAVGREEQVHRQRYFDSVQATLAQPPPRDISQFLCTPQITNVSSQPVPNQPHHHSAGMFAQPNMEEIMKKQMSSMFAQYSQQITSQVDHLVKQRVRQQEEKEKAHRLELDDRILRGYFEYCDMKDNESDDLDPNCVSESF